MIHNMTGWLPVYKRELKGYFITPLAYIFLVIFLVLEGVFTFYLGGFFERGQADLVAFFTYQPWLYLFLIPAIAMRLWAEEKRTGTLELMLTLPVAATGAVMGKYLAALTFAALAIGLTFPMWITVNYLGDPDNGVIFISYIGALLVAASYLAIGMALSIFTSNQVIALVLSVAICFMFTVTGMPIVLDSAAALLPDTLVLALANLSILTHFGDLQRGVITLPSLFFFLSLIFLWIWICRLGLNMSREAN